MTAHIHATLMLQYAQDAATTDKPWELWEYSSSIDKWDELKHSPSWNKGTKYRRKPRTIRIGEIDIPEPVREPLQDGKEYFLPAIECGDAHVDKSTWDGDSTDKRLLKQGFVHLTEESALEHAKALIALTAKE